MGQVYTQICPGCKKRVSKMYNFCIFCGHQLKQKGNFTPTLDLMKITGHHPKECQKCHVNNLEEAKFCCCCEKELKKEVVKK